MTGAQAAGLQAAKRTAPRRRPSRPCRPTAGTPRPASGTPSWWAGTSGAPRASRFITCAMRPRPTKRCRMPSSRRTQHLASFREELPFEVWFTRILINGCLDRIKARTRRERWIAPMPDGPAGERDFGERVAGNGPSPEDQLLARERRETAGARAVEAAGAPALRVHAEPLRGLHVAGSQRADGAERIDGTRAPVPRDPQAAHAARRRETGETNVEKRRVHP